MVLACVSPTKSVGVTKPVQVNHVRKGSSFAPQRGAMTSTPTMPAQRNHNTRGAAPQGHLRPTCHKNSTTCKAPRRRRNCKFEGSSERRPSTESERGKLGKHGRDARDAWPWCGTSTSASQPWRGRQCALCDRLIAQLRRLGMKASFGIDRVVKATCKAPVIKLNLRDPHGEELAHSYLRNPKSAYARFGIPCGQVLGLVKSQPTEIPMRRNPSEVPSFQKAYQDLLLKTSSEPALRTPSILPVPG